jgi:hypothetical protein
MGGAFVIGRISGIDVRVHWTFFLLLAFFAFIGYQASGLTKYLLESWSK